MLTPKRERHQGLGAPVRGTGWRVAWAHHVVG